VEPQAGPFSAESQSPEATAREGRAVSKRKITLISGAIDWCVLRYLIVLFIIAELIRVDDH
jgi:hypothetical protein